MQNMKNFIAELVLLYTNMQEFTEQEKAIKTAIKEAGGDSAIVSAVAKAVVADKVDALEEKAATTQLLIEQSRD
jgi:predicted nucleic acid-binding protein